MNQCEAPEEDFSLKQYFIPFTRTKAITFIILIGFFVFFNSLFGSFVLDDESQLLGNPIVHSLSNFFTFFTGSTFTNGGSGHLAGTYYKPVLSTFFALIYSLFGPQPFPFHLFQLTIHIVNTFLVYLLLRRFFTNLVSFLLGLVFLIHPINEEAVVYIANLQEVLFLNFGLSALLLSFSEKITNKRLLLINVLILLALLSKETAVLFIFVTILFHVLYKKKSFSWPFISSFFVTSGIYLLLRFSIAHLTTFKDNAIPIDSATLSTRLLNIPSITAYYLKTFLYPKDLAVCQYGIVDKATLAQFYLPLLFVSLFLVLLVLFGLFIYYKSKQQFPVFLFFLCWFLLGLLLHLQIVPLDYTLADRWFYFPIIGLLGLIGLLVSQIKFHRENVKKLCTVVAVMIIVLLAIRTLVRNTNWVDGYTLYSHDLAISPNNVCLEMDLGVELLRRKQYVEANKHLQNAIKLQPSWGRNWINLGAVSDALGNYQLSEKYYAQSILLSHMAQGYEGLSGDYLYYDKDPKRASQILEEGLKRYPVNQRLLFFYAIAQYTLGNKQVALAAAQKANQIASNDESAYIIYQITNNLPIEIK